MGQFGILVPVRETKSLSAHCSVQSRGTKAKNDCSDNNGSGLHFRSLHCMLGAVFSPARCDKLEA